MQGQINPSSVNPGPAGQRQVFATAGWVIAVFAVLGLALVSLAVAFVFVARNLVAGLLLISLPCGVLGLWLLTRLPVLIRASIVVQDTGVRLHLPVWAAGWMRRGKAVELAWSDITGLTHTLKVYHIPLMPLAVAEYTLHTTKGNYIITKNIIPQPERVMAIIAARTGKPVEERSP